MNKCDRLVQLVRFIANNKSQSPGYVLLTRKKAKALLKEIGESAVKPVVVVDYPAVTRRFVLK